VADYSGYSEYAGAGFENQTADDYAIPFLGILQALSPELQTHPEWRQGMIYNTVTGETYPGNEGVSFVPALTNHQYVEFRPRASGGGFVGVHEVNSDVVKNAISKSTEFGDYKTPDGNELIETFYVYGIAFDAEGSPFEAVLAFNSTKIKVYKGWMTKAKTIQLDLGNGRRIAAPLMAHRYRLTTQVQKNPKGTFYNWMLAFDGEDARACRLAPNDPVFQQAIAIKSLIETGKARAAHETQGAAGNDEQNGAGGAGGKPVF
jgi:hypothetical protein